MPLSHFLAKDILEASRPTQSLQSINGILLNNGGSRSWNYGVRTMLMCGERPTVWIGLDASPMLSWMALNEQTIPPLELAHYGYLLLSNDVRLVVEPKPGDTEFFSDHSQSETVHQTCSSNGNRPITLSYHGVVTTRSSVQLEFLASTASAKAVTLLVDSVSLADIMAKTLRVIASTASKALTVKPCVEPGANLPQNHNPLASTAFDTARQIIHSITLGFYGTHRLLDNSARFKEMDSELTALSASGSATTNSLSQIFATAVTPEYVVFETLTQPQGEFCGADLPAVKVKYINAQAAQQETTVNVHFLASDLHIDAISYGVTRSQIAAANEGSTADLHWARLNLPIPRCAPAGSTLVSSQSNHHERRLESIEGTQLTPYSTVASDTIPQIAAQIETFFKGHSFAQCIGLLQKENAVLETFSKLIVDTIAALLKNKPSQEQSRSGLTTYVAKDTSTLDRVIATIRSGTVALLTTMAEIADILTSVPALFDKCVEDPTHITSDAARDSVKFGRLINEHMGQPSSKRQCNKMLQTLESEIKKKVPSYQIQQGDPEHEICKMFDTILQAFKPTSTRFGQTSCNVKRKVYNDAEAIVYSEAALTINQPACGLQYFLPVVQSASVSALNRDGGFTALDGMSSLFSAHAASDLWDAAQHSGSGLTFSLKTFAKDRAAYIEFTLGPPNSVATQLGWTFVFDEQMRTGLISFVSALNSEVSGSVIISSGTCSSNVPACELIAADSNYECTFLASDSFNGNFNLKLPSVGNLLQQAPSTSSLQKTFSFSTPSSPSCTTTCGNTCFARSMKQLLSIPEGEGPISFDITQGAPPVNLNTLYAHFIYQASSQFTDLPCADLYIQQMSTVSTRGSMDILYSCSRTAMLALSIPVPASG